MEAGTAARELSFDRKLALFGLLGHSLTQLKSISSVDVLSTEWCLRVVSIFFVSTYWLWPTLRPASYLRWRTPYQLAMHLVYWSSPLLRSNKGIQRVLDSPPGPGPLGLAGDLLKVVWGEWPRGWRAAALPAALAGGEGLGQSTR